MPVSCRLEHIDSPSGGANPPPCHRPSLVFRSDCYSPRCTLVLAARCSSALIGFTVSVEGPRATPETSRPRAAYAFDAMPAPSIRPIPSCNSRAPPGPCLLSNAFCNVLPLCRSADPSMIDRRETTFRIASASPRSFPPFQAPADKASNEKYGSVVPVIRNHPSRSNHLADGHRFPRSRAYYLPGEPFEAGLRIVRSHVLLSGSTLESRS